MNSNKKNPTFANGMLYLGADIGFNDNKEFAKAITNELYGEKERAVPEHWVAGSQLPRNIQDFKKALLEVCKTQINKQLSNLSYDQCRTRVEKLVQIRNAYQRFGWDRESELPENSDEWRDGPKNLESRLQTPKTITEEDLTVVGLVPVNKNYFIPGVCSGGVDPLRASFEYTTHNKELFVERIVQNKILEHIRTRGPKAIILANGESGFGKTTVLRKSMEVLTEKSRTFVFFSDYYEAEDFFQFVDKLAELDPVEVDIIVFVDRLVIDDISENQQIARLFDFVIKENKYDLIWSPRRSPSDGKQEYINDSFKNIMEHAFFENFHIIDVTAYDHDSKNLLSAYKTRFPSGRNENALRYLIEERAPLAFIGSLIARDDNLEDGLIELLSRHLLEDELWTLATVTFFTRNGISLWYFDVLGFREPNLTLIRLRDAGFLTLEDLTFRGISEFYDTKIFDLIPRTLELVPSYNFLKHVLRQIIDHFYRINPLIKLLRNQNTVELKVIQLSILRNFSIVLQKSNIYDLIDLKKLVVHTELILESERHDLMARFANTLAILKIENRKAFKVLKRFYSECVNYFSKSGLDAKLPNNDFTIQRYSYSKSVTVVPKFGAESSSYLKLDLVMEDYQTNWNTVAYILSSSIKSELYYLDSLECHEYDISTETKIKIQQVINDLYRNIERLTPIEYKIFATLFAYYVLYESELRISNYNYELIFNNLAQQFKYSRQHYSKVLKAFHRKSLLSIQILSIDKLIESDRLANNGVIFHLWFTYLDFTESQLLKILNYIYRKAEQGNKDSILQFFWMFDKFESFFYKHSEKVNLLLEKAVSGAYADAKSYQAELMELDGKTVYKPEYLLKGKVPPESLLGQVLRVTGDEGSRLDATNRREAISRYLRRTSNNRIASMYIRIMLILDEVRDKFQMENINFDKYEMFLLANPQVIIDWLYNRYKRFMINDSVTKYLSYCNERKLMGISFEYIPEAKDYERYRTQARILYTVISRFYFNKRGVKVNKNTIANVLAYVDSEKFKEEIISLFRNEILQNNSVNQQKSIVDLANFYSSINNKESLKLLIKDHFASGKMRITNYRIVGYLRSLLFENGVRQQSEIDRHISRRHQDLYFGQRAFIDASSLIQDGQEENARVYIEKQIKKKPEILTHFYNANRVIRFLVKSGIDSSTVVSFIRKLYDENSQLEWRVIRKAQKLSDEGNIPASQSAIGDYFSNGKQGIWNWETIEAAILILSEQGLSRKGRRKFIHSRHSKTYSKYISNKKQFDRDTGSQQRKMYQLK